MNHLLPLFILAAGPSFTSPDLAQRRQAAEVWSRRHGVAFSARALKSLEKQGVSCVRLRSPGPAACGEVLEFCVWGQSGGSCSGSWMQTQGLAKSDGGAAIELIDRAGWEPDAFECEKASIEFMFLGDGGRLVRSERERRREIDQCLREERANARSQETNLACDVMAVNPCLKEAYLSCRGRLNGVRVSRTSWVTWADGGDPEWEHPLGVMEDEPDDGG